MKKIFAGIVCVTLIITCLLFSCKKPGGNAEPNNIVFDSVNVSKVYHLDNDSTKPSCSLKIQYIFPVEYKNKDVLNKIQGELNVALMEDETYQLLSPSDAVKKYAEDYITNYKQEAETQFGNWEESDESEDYFSYYKTIKTNIVFDKADLLSYQVVSMDYKGGASSSTIYRNIVLDLTTGNQLTEKDIFIDDYSKSLNQLLSHEIIKQNGVKSAEDLLELGFWGIEDLTSNNNFSVDEKGLTYIINQGEYSAPSLGEIRIFFPYSEILDLLKENSPISRLTGK